VTVKYELRAVDPFNLVGGGADPEERLVELRKVESIYQEGRRTIHALTALLLSEERYEEGRAQAERFVENYPKNPNSTYLLGYAIAQSGDCDEALEWFARSLEYSAFESHHILYKHIGRCHYEKRRFLEAYEAFRRGLNPYTRAEASEDLYQYAYSAIAAGDLSLAERTLRQMLYVVEPEKTDLIEDARGLLEKIETGQLSDVGVGDWLRSLIGQGGLQPRS
jgi:tetratricopeptide (TPR) repeat protein